MLIVCLTKLAKQIENTYQLAERSVYYFTKAIALCDNLKQALFRKAFNAYLLITNGLFAH